MLLLGIALDRFILPHDSTGPKENVWEGPGVVEDLAGTWRQETQTLGVSYWELTPKGNNTCTAQEYGLNGVKGTARLVDGHLIIDFEDTVAKGKGTYDWHLKGIAGKGKLVFMRQDGQIQGDRQSSVRFIGK
jgi:hypothetical protein